MPATTPTPNTPRVTPSGVRVPNVSQAKQPMLRSLENQSTNKNMSPTNQGMPRHILILSALIIIGVGVLTGYFVAPSKLTGNSSTPVTDLPAGSNKQSAKATTDSEGINDDQLFPDVAEGTLQRNEGKVTTEGTHILIREGGPSQTAYLTSSVVDLDKYVGNKVKIKGQTNTAQTAGWLLEVGWIELAE